MKSRSTEKPSDHPSQRNFEGGAHIFIVDGNPKVRKIAENVGAKGEYLFTFFDDEESCYNNLRNHKCDLLVFDIKPSEFDGFEFLAKVKQILPSLPVLLMTGCKDLSFGIRAMKAGALNVIHKPVNEQTLLQIIESSLRHGKDSDTFLKFFLSRREIEVVKLLVNGRSNKEIARELYIATRTVEFHRGRIMHKLNIERLPDLVKIAISIGLTSPVVDQE